MEESYHQKYKEFSQAQRGVKKAEDPPDEEKPSFADMMSNPKDNALFPEYLEHHGAKDIAERLLKNEPTDQDIEKLAGLQENYLKKKEEIQQTLEKISPEFLNDAAEGSPEFSRIITLAGAENVKQVIAAYLEQIGIRDEARYNEMCAKIRALEAVEEKWQKQYKKMESLAEQYGLKGEQFDEIVRIKKSDERVEALSELIKENLHIMELGWGKKKQARIQERAETILKDGGITELRREARQIDQAIKDVGDSLFAVYKDIPEIHKAVNLVISGQSVSEAIGKQEEKMGLAEGQRAVKNAQQEFDTFKKTDEGKKLISDPDKLKEEFVKQQGVSFKKKGGMYNTFMGVYKTVVSGLK